MQELGRLANWFKIQLAQGRPLVRVGWAILAVLVLFYAGLVALAYELVRRLDRSDRVGVGPHWALAVILVVGLLGLYGALRSPDADVAQSARPIAALPELSAPAASATTVPTAKPSPAPMATLTLAPATTPPIEILEILAPLDGVEVTEARLVVSGLARVGARVVRDISFAGDDEVIAGVDGSWSIAVDLDVGENVLVFRIGDDYVTERRILVRFVEPATPTPTLPPATPKPTPTRKPTSTPTPAPATWTSEFEVFVCSGVRELDDAGGHLAEAGTAAEVFDIDRIIEESEQAAEDATQSGEALDFAPAWRPGIKAVDALRAAAQQTLVAANLLKLGAQTLDAEIITEAGDALSKAVDLKFDAAALLFDLEQTTGFSCF